MFTADLDSSSTPCAFLTRPKPIYFRKNFTGKIWAGQIWKSRFVPKASLPFWWLGTFFHSWCLPRRESLCFCWTGRELDRGSTGILMLSFRNEVFTLTRSYLSYAQVLISAKQMLYFIQKWNCSKLKHSAVSGGEKKEVINCTFWNTI